MTCQICGEGHNAVLDFHHLDPSTKDISVSDLKSSDYSPYRMVEEISKCACLCANCHRKLHYFNNVKDLTESLSLKKESKSRLTKTVDLAIREWLAKSFS
jgi:hypothetical protein